MTGLAGGRERQERRCMSPLDFPTAAGCASVATMGAEEIRRRTRL